MVEISSDELAILATAIAMVQKHGERMRNQVLCSDGKLRRFSKDQAVDLIDRMAQLNGYAPGVAKRDGLVLARKVRL